MAYADYDHEKIFSFAVLCVKLWLKEDGDLHTFKFVHSKAQKLCKMLSSLNHNFKCSIAKLEISHIRNQQ